MRESKKKIKLTTNQSNYLSCSAVLGRILNRMTIVERGNIHIYT